MTPKQAQELKKLSEEILKIEKLISEQTEKAAEKSGRAYEAHKKYLLGKGKELKDLKREKELKALIRGEQEKVLDVADKTKLAAYDLKDNEEEIEKLVKKISKSRGDLNKKEKEALTARVGTMKLNHEAAKQAKERNKLEDMLGDKIGFTRDGMRETVAQAKLLMRALLKNPMLLMMAAGYAIGKGLQYAAEQAMAFRDTVGASVNQVTKLTLNTKAAQLEAKALGYNVQNITNNLVDSFGTLDGVSSSSIRTIGQFEKILGVTPEHSAGLLKQMESVSGLTGEAAIFQLKNTAALAEANDIPVGKLFEDMAGSSEEIAAYGGENLDNMKRAAIEARKMGVNLSTSLKIADSLLDFESSISNEMEASLLIGKQLNFNRARQLALEGDVAGAARDVVKQIGGQAEFAKLNVIQRKKLAESIGVSVDELSKLSSGKVEFKKPEQSAEEKLTDKTAQAAAATMNLSDKIPMLTAAVGLLTAVMATKAFQDMGGMKGLKNMFGLGGKGKGMSKAAKTGLTKSGKFDMRTNKGKELAKEAAEKKAKQAAKKKAATEAAKQTAKQTAKTATTKVAAKGVAKGAGKSLLKKIPGIGLIAGLGFAAGRIMDGDVLGALGEVASGAASIIPGVGTAASMAIDAALVAKDVSAASKGASETATQVAEEASKNIEEVSKANAASEPIAPPPTPTDSNTNSFVVDTTEAGMAGKSAEEIQREISNAESLVAMRQASVERAQNRAEQDNIITARENERIKRHERSVSIAERQVEILQEKLQELIAATKNVGKDVKNQAME